MMDSQNLPNLEFLPLELTPMTSKGSSFLRSIQNDEMILLDLLVREAVQNSLDASLDIAETVTVKFRVTSSTPSAVTKLFPQLNISDTECVQQPMLEIRDTGTTGLSGSDPGETGKLEGNYASLVFEIGDAQRKDGAGGSWGLGKTVYYRMGLGLIIYYSRTRCDSGEYISRLAACYVEDETADNSRLSEAPIGIAWWGGAVSRYNGVDWISSASARNIDLFLHSLGIEPFSHSETGTSVIIPLLKPYEILPEQWLAGTRSPDKRDIAEYISAAVQRWYAVRLNNREYPFGPCLRVSINDEFIEERDIRPIFKQVRRLYKAAYMNDDSVFKDAIVLKNTFSGASKEAGYLLSAFLDRNDLGMNPPDNEPSPFSAIAVGDTVPPFPPLFAFLRSPGMILSWNEDRWMKNLPSTEKKFFLALFVANTNAMLNKEYAEQTGFETLEDYLRSTEKASHLTWQDSGKLGSKGVVKRIKEGIARKINAQVCPQEQSISSLDLPLARRLSEAFLPAGSSKLSRKTTSSHSHRKSPVPKLSLSLESLAHSKKAMIVEWQLYWGSVTRHCQKLALEVSSESGAITHRQWEEDQSLGEFPFLFSNITIENVDNRKRGSNPECCISADLNETVSNRFFSLDNRGHCILINNCTGELINRWVLHGTIEISKQSTSALLRPEVKLSSENGVV